MRVEGRHCQPDPSQRHAGDVGDGPLGLLTSYPQAPRLQGLLEADQEKQE